MNHVVICDESYTSGRYFVLGALILPSRNHPILCEEVRAWKSKNCLNPASEFKWTKVSGKYHGLYAELMQWFFQHIRANHVRFRSLIMDTSDRHYPRFSNRDPETGFYKAYYHLLFQSVKGMRTAQSPPSAVILLDEMRNRYPFRREVLKKSLNGALLRDYGMNMPVANIENRPSSGPKAECLIQVVDVLVGAIGFVRHGRHTMTNSSPWKRRLVATIEEAAGTSLSYDSMPGAPFNLWTFDLRIAAQRRRAWRKRRRKGKRPQA